ncbi:MAG: 50S ribosomal protein L3 [Fidelibacterota bacterium]
MTGLIGKKVGMTRIFDSDGKSIPVTVIRAGPCVVTQVKTREVDGYDAVQVGFGERKKQRTNRPLKGHFEKAGVSPKQHVMEFPIGRGRRPKPGQRVTVSMFREGDVISVRGTSKGKGFAGVVKRYGFRGGPATHGQSDRLRAPGSIGQSSYPSRVWRGMKMPGQHGDRTVAVKNLKVVKVDSEENTLFVKGAVPGTRNGLLALIK